MTDSMIVDRRSASRGTPDRRQHPRDVFVEFRDVHKAYGPKNVLRGAAKLVITVDLTFWSTSSISG